MGGLEVEILPFTRVNSHSAINLRPTGGKMQADRQTLMDLEILRSRDGGPSVGDLLIRTCTSPGDIRFRGWLAQPMSDAGAIAARQESIRFVHASGLEFILPRVVVQDVERYIDSRFETLRASSLVGEALEATWIGLRYSELVPHAERGFRALRELAGLLRPVAASLRDQSPPEALAELTGEILAVLDALAVHLPGDGASSRKRLIADRALRRDHPDTIRKLLELLGELDAIFSGAALLAEGYVLPEIVTNSSALIEGTGIWHPFLPGAVRNPVTLAGGETLVFLTGPNMAGKSTYLRAVGVCAYLAHCGVPVPAAMLRFAPVDGLFTSISPEDHLRSGLSYFMAEVRRVREVAEQVVSGRRTLAIFDEVFRGTNVKDALEASRAVIRGCARARQSGFLFSSHLTELAEDLANESTVRFLCFDAAIDGSEAVFDYALREGVSDRRFGMELLRREGVTALLASMRGGN